MRKSVFEFKFKNQSSKTSHNIIFGELQIDSVIQQKFLDQSLLQSVIFQDTLIIDRMSSNLRKDFYKTLGVKSSATKNQIDAAYQTLASKYHPDKNPNDRIGAQRKFNEVTESYINLSNPSRRHEYDVLTSSNYTLDDAYKIFDRFYEDRGIFSQQEKSFFNKHYPQKKKNYYQILGVRRNAPLDEIKRAYKKLALKYHPRANPGDKQAEQHFLEVSDAYNHLSDPTKRNIYNVSLSGQIKPHVAHNIYQGYNALKQSQNRGLTNLHPETEYAQSLTESYYSQKTPHGVVGKTVTHKSSLENGKKISVATQQILKPDGSKEITETRNQDGKVTTKKYHLAKGEQKPKLALGHGHHHRELHHHAHEKDHKDDKQHKEIKK